MPWLRPLDAVLGVDALDHHHRHQHLDLRDLRRIAREERLDVVGLRRDDHEVDPIRRNIDPSQGRAALIHLRDDDAAAEGGGLDDGRRVFRVRPRVEIAGVIDRLGGDQCDVRREVDEIAGEELEIGVDCIDADLAIGNQRGQARSLRARERKVDLAGDAGFEERSVLRQGDDRLHHVQVVDPGRIDRRQRPGEKIGLLLIVALQADAVALLEHCLEQGRGVLACHPAALCERAGALQTCGAPTRRGVPLSGIHAGLRWVRRTR